MAGLVDAFDKKAAMSLEFRDESEVVSLVSISPPLGRPDRHGHTSKGATVPVVEIEGRLGLDAALAELDATAD